MPKGGFAIKDDNATVAGPRGGKRQYADVIDSLVTRLANRPQIGVKEDIPSSELELPDEVRDMGARLATNDPRTPSGAATAVQEGLRALAIHPFNRTTPGYQTAVVANPRSALSKYVAENYPKYYRYFDQPAKELAAKGKASNYRFEVVPKDPSQAQMGMPNLTNRHGAAMPRSAGKDADVYINEEVWNYLRNPHKLAELRRTDPPKYREIISTLPHEMNHALNARIAGGEAANNWGFPDVSGRVYRRMSEYVKGVKPNSAEPSEGRMGPLHLQAFMNRYTRRGYPESLGVQEALIQRSGENAARSRGFATRKEIKSDVPPPEAMDWARWVTDTPASIAARIRARVRPQE